MLGHKELFVCTWLAEWRELLSGFYTETLRSRYDDQVRRNEMTTIPLKLDISLFAVLPDYIFLAICSIQGLMKY
jgi:hypothetical protein